MSSTVFPDHLINLDLTANLPIHLFAVAAHLLFSRSPASFFPKLYVKFLISSNRLLQLLDHQSNPPRHYPACTLSFNRGPKHTVVRLTYVLHLTRVTKWFLFGNIWNPPYRLFQGLLAHGPRQCSRPPGPRSGNCLSPTSTNDTRSTTPVTSYIAHIRCLTSSQYSFTGATLHLRTHFCTWDRHLYAVRFTCESAWPTLGLQPCRILVACLTTQ